MTPQQFCNSILPYAASAAVTTGVNPIGMMAQAALESGWGKYAPGNMYFGIKATPSWTGATQLLWTTEVIDGEKKRVQAKFRAYTSPADSFKDYARLISTTPRYRNALLYPGYNQVNNYLNAVSSAGYATATQYYSTLVSIANDIKKYVTPAMLDAAVKKKV